MEDAVSWALTTLRRGERSLRVLPKLPSSACFDFFTFLPARVPPGSLSSGSDRACSSEAALGSGD